LQKDAPLLVVLYKEHINTWSYIMFHTMEIVEFKAAGFASIFKYYAKKDG
jgi:hypothetical protein